jgi:plastocyanin
MAEHASRARHGILALLGAMIACGTLHAGQLEVSVTDGDARLADAVVSLHSAAAARAVKPGSAVVDQRDTQFVPRVSVIPAGSRIRFPNSDNVRHQVYSFSPAKRFQLPLYSGTAAAPVLFDRAGIIELGCNIHDWMVAYVVVLDTPYHAISDKAGRTRIEAPAGRYTLRVWHPRLANGGVRESDIEIGSAPVRRDVALALAEQVAPVAPTDEKLRALQEKFRKLKRAR